MIRLEKRQYIKWFPLFLASLSLGLSLCISACSGYRQGRESGVAAGASKPVQIAGCYSNMYYNEEGGDLLDFEFVIVPSPSGYLVLYQEAGGSPFEPQLLPIQVEGASIHFTIPSDGRNDEFTGTIKSDRLIGEFIYNASQQKVVLKRKSSYWIWDTESPHMNGCYSNIHYDRASGNVYGYKFLIVLGPWDDELQYFLLYQHFENGKADVSLLMPIDKREKKEGKEIKDYSIRFTLPQDNPHHGEFQGVITADGLTGQFSDGEPILLKRSKECCQ